MNEAEAKQFIDDLAKGAYKCGTVEQHKVAVDMWNAINGHEPTFPNVWKSWNNE